MTAQYLPQFKPQFLDQNGNPLSNGKVFTYEAGTTDLLETFSDIEGTTENTNPVNLDSAGRANIYMISGRQYKITVTDENEVPQYTVDNITGSSGGGGGFGVNIVSFGADPTGVEDSTAAIIAAMEEASTQKTIIYAPAGEYKITSTITNAGTRANCMGIVGDTGFTTRFIGTTLTSDAFVFTDIPSGSRFEHFSIWGPGQTAPVTSRGLVFDLVAGANIYSQTMNDVRIYLFPTAGFEWWVPITSTFNNLVTQECGARGFYVRPKVGVFVGGTSTSWNGCYANNTIGKGFDLLGHGYFAMNGMANDNCNYGYYFENSYCGSLNGMGSEVNTYVDTNNPGIGMYIKAGYGFNLKGLWTYNMTNVLSRALVLDATGGSTIMNCSGYSDNGINPTYECEIKGFGEGITFIENYPVGNNTGPTFRQASTWRINNVNGTGVINIYNGKVRGLNFDEPDVFGNSLYVRNGNLVVSSEEFDGVFLFKEGFPDFPTAGLDNSGTLFMGTGAAASDVYLTRASSGVLNIGGSGTGNGTLNIDGDLNVTGVISGSASGLTFETPDIFGNSLYVENGNLLVIGNTTKGLQVFETGKPDFPRAAITATGDLSFGLGTVATDVALARSAAGQLTISGSGSAAGSLIVNNQVSAGGRLIYNNLSANNQTTISNSNVTLTGWNTSTLNYVSGGNAAGSIGINAAGTPSANPVVRVTYQSPVPATYSTIPLIIITTYQAASLSGYWQLTNQTATYFEVTYIGTPVSGFSYGFNFLVLGL